MKPIYLAVTVAALLLPSCEWESSPEHWQKEGFRDLPVASQVAVIVRSPLIFFALAAIIAAGRSK